MIEKDNAVKNQFYTNYIKLKVTKNSRYGIYNIK
jgi:hypothetical protein